MRLPVLSLALLLTAECATVPQAILQRLRTAFKVAVVPAVKRPAGDTELVQRARGGQVRLLDDPDDRELLGCVMPHSPPSPSAIILF